MKLNKLLISIGLASGLMLAGQLQARVFVIDDFNTDTFYSVTDTDPDNVESNQGTGVGPIAASPSPGFPAGPPRNVVWEFADRIELPLGAGPTIDPMGPNMATRTIYAELDFLDSLSTEVCVNCQAGHLVSGAGGAEGHSVFNYNGPSVDVSMAKTVMFAYASDQDDVEVVFTFGDEGGNEGTVSSGPLMNTNNSSNIAMFGEEVSLNLPVGVVDYTRLTSVTIDINGVPDLDFTIDNVKLILEESLAGFKCYFGKQLPPFDEANPRLPFPVATVQLSDQFQSRTYDALFLLGLCNSALKNDLDPGAIPPAHQTCYKLRSAPGQDLFIPPRAVEIETENFGEETFRLGQPLELCNPAVKTVLPDGVPQGSTAGTDYLCYHTAGSPPQNVDVTLRDQFSTWKSSDTVPEGWETLEFDDSSWAFARAPYFSPTDPGDLIPGTSAQHMWHDPDGTSNGENGPIEAFFRLTFNIQPGSLPLSAQAQISVDDDYEFYVNGNLVKENKDGGFADQVDVVDFSTELRNGKNVLAIHAVDGGWDNPRDRQFERVLFDATINGRALTEARIGRLSQFCTPAGKNDPDFEPPTEDPEDPTTWVHLACYDIVEQSGPALPIDVNVVDQFTGPNGVTQTVERTQRWCERALKANVINR